MVNTQNIKILVIGQSKPVESGQVVMINKMLNHEYSRIEFIFVEMNFSNSIDEMGKFQIWKIFLLLKVVYKIIYIKLTQSINILYYPPAGNKIIPIIRDIILLLFSRLFFKKIIFHFHASGLSDGYERIPTFFRYFFRLAYYKPDLTIRISQYNPEDGKFLKSKRDIVIYNGLEDYSSTNFIAKRNKTEVIILFVGLISFEKGIVDLIQAAALLRKKQFILNLAGKFYSDKIKEHLHKIIFENNLQSKIRFPGIIKSNEKWRYFSECDIFCLPSHFETFSLAILEAMQFCKPIVATSIGGINELVKTGENGILVDVGNIYQIKEALQILIENPELRQKYGANSRQKYLDNFTLKHFHSRIEETFFESFATQNNITKNSK